jgi:hypothetical protein
MAKMLQKGGNVLLLDEPTNDLDVETLRALEDALENFAGCAGGDQPRPLLPRSPRDHILPSKATATSNGSKAISKPMRRTSGRRMGPEADRPHRMSYKKLTR